MYPSFSFTNYHFTDIFFIFPLLLLTNFFLSFKANHRYHVISLKVFHYASLTEKNFCFFYNHHAVIPNRIMRNSLMSSDAQSTFRFPQSPFKVRFFKPGSSSIQILHFVFYDSLSFKCCQFVGEIRSLSYKMLHYLDLPECLLMVLVNFFLCPLSVL